MIEEAGPDARRAGEVERAARLAGLHAAEQFERAVERADVAVGGDDHARGGWRRSF